MNMFDAFLLTEDDYELAVRYVGMRINTPDLVIAPDTEPYLYRWHIVPRNRDANVYFHIQVADDPERPLHDHPWWNQSTILSGGYRETYANTDDEGRLLPSHVRWVKKGQTVHRPAEQAHRLLLLPGIAYTMTLFTTGAHTRTWGFWYLDGWVSNEEVCQTSADGSMSSHLMSRS